MVSILRKYQQSIMIFVTILVIVTFIWFWNGSQAGRAGLSDTKKRATIYGRAITDDDIKQDVRKFQLAAGLGLNDLVQGLSGSAQTQQEALENFVFNSYVFDHEADALQIFPTADQIQDEEAKVPAFQTDGKFDADKFKDVVSSKLPSLGFTDAVIDDLVREQVRVTKVRALIGATVIISPAELENRFTAENEKMNLAVVRLSLADLQKGIAVTDADAQKAYDQHKDAYRSDEQRKVDIASFELSDAQKDLKGKDRTDALQKLSTDVANFIQAVVDKNSDFTGIAARSGGKITTTGMFTQAQPDPAIEKINDSATAAFKLTADIPNSDPLEGVNGYYVLHLKDTVPSRQLSFNEAKPKVIAEVQKERATQMMETTANQTRDNILAGLKAGKSFTDAATAAGTTAETIPAFSLLDASKLDVPDLQQIVTTSIALNDGQLSQFVPSEAGGVLVYMVKRDPIPRDSATVTEAMMKGQFETQKQFAAFVEWLRLCKEAAKLQIFQG